MPRNAIPDSAGPNGMPPFMFINHPNDMPEMPPIFDHDEAGPLAGDGDGEAGEAEDKPRERLMKLDKM